MSAVDALPPLPPSYSSPPTGTDNDLDNLDDSSLASELPAYTPGRASAPGVRVGSTQSEPKEFRNELKNRKGMSFASLTIIAEAAYSKHLPTFVENTPVKGKVQLTLDKPETIQSVIVSILGQVITGANTGEQLTFIDISRTLWSQADGEPHRNTTNTNNGNSSPAGTNGATGSSPKFSGKLQGDYTWDFSIDIPKEVVLPFGARNEPQVFNPPVTFNERHTRASINYEVSVRFSRGKLRTDYRIPAQFGYVPVTRPPPFPNLRRLAYLQGTPLLGPTVDPDGWIATDPVQIQGTSFNNRPVQVTCTLYLAKPLSYTRGSLIPFCLRLGSADKQVLDLLSAPKAIVLRLRRRIKTYWNADKSLEPATWKDAIDHSQLAVWWPSTEGSEADDSGHVRFVNGELHLRSDIKPTSAMAHFRIQYSAILLPFDTPGFVSSDTEPLIEHPVDIVTAFASGPRPRMSAPPGYESDSAITAAPMSISFARLGFF